MIVVRIRSLVFLLMPILLLLFFVLTLLVLAHVTGHGGHRHHRYLIRNILRLLMTLVGISPPTKKI